MLMLAVIFPFLNHISLTYVRVLKAYMTCLVHVKIFKAQNQYLVWQIDAQVMQYYMHIVKALASCPVIVKLLN